jgi:diaminohydroxyphosphoribosylaminopyrimidine deaminase / 5-amino-6-(5-phosphoribosylamino)uracil reductase
MEDKLRTKYMQQALRLALKGAGFVAPNPIVGAVIVKDNRVIGKGYHQKFGGPHAEIEALNDCTRKGNDPYGATLFVTLEPCCHHGKTAPCTDAIIQSGITHVEIATLDLNPTVQGRGVAQLTENSITVNVGCCERKACRINTGFFRHIRTGRPGVILKWAQSLDAKLDRRSTNGTIDSSERWISNVKSRRHVHQIRSQCGAVLVGIGTVLADDPLLTVRLKGKRYQPRRAVLDSQLRIPEDSQLVKTATEAPVLIYTLEQCVRNKRGFVSGLQERECEVIGVAARDGRVDLEAVLTDLGRRGVTDLLVEGGAAVLKGFAEQKLVDKFMIYIAPILIGGPEDTAKIDFGIPCDQLHDITITKFDTDILIEAFTQAL